MEKGWNRFHQHLTAVPRVGGGETHAEKNDELGPVSQGKKKGQESTKPQGRF